MFLFQKVLFSTIVLYLYHIRWAKALSLSQASRPSIASSNAATITASPHLQSNASIYGELIPGLLSADCVSETRPPCIAVCSGYDTACRDAASSISLTCAPQWDSYLSTLVFSTLPSSNSWSWVTKLHTKGAGTYTSTWSEYTTFSTVLETTIIGYSTTFEPVYALGTPITHRSVYTSLGWSESWLTAPPPSCRFNAVSWLTNTDSETPLSPFSSFSHTCGKCTIYGGTVELLWWPDLATGSMTVTGSVAHDAQVTRSTVLNGTTLVSPTVYISLHTIFASDYCSVVGQKHTSTLLAMNPTDVSTQYHFGGKAIASGANSYGPLNYTHLTGLPPVSEYEHQPSCIFGGCPTIYPIPVKPTLVVPSQIRSMDPAWADCDGALGGLYDPPIALEAHPTRDPDSGGISSYPGPSPHQQAPNPATKTWTLNSAISTTEVEHRSLANVLGSDPKGQKTRSEKPQKTRTKLNHKPEDTGSASAGDHHRSLEQSHVVATSSVVRTHAIESEKAQSTRKRKQVTRQSDGPSESNSHLQISVNSESQYVVNGQVFAPSSPITLSGTHGMETYRMLTSKSRTYIAMGTSTTVQFGGAEAETNGSPDLAFTRASDGNFVLRGTTLASGEPVTIGNGSSKTTLRITTISSLPAVILDGNRTQFLGHAEPSSSGLPPIFSAPTETYATPKQTRLKSQTTSSVSKSGAAILKTGCVGTHLLLMAILHFYWMWPYR